MNEYRVIQNEVIKENGFVKGGGRIWLGVLGNVESFCSFIWLLVETWGIKVDVYFGG